MSALQLRSQMEETHRIQRLRRPLNGLHSPYDVGLSEQALAGLAWAFRFDYMGSALFEDNSVPETLSFLWEQSQKGNLIWDRYQGVYYMCPRPYQQGVKDLIDVLLRNEAVLHLTEHCGLKQALTEGYRDVVGWLELDNGFFFFIDEEMFEKTRQLFPAQGSL